MLLILPMRVTSINWVSSSAYIYSYIRTTTKCCSLISTYVGVATIYVCIHNYYEYIYINVQLMNTQDTVMISVG